MPHLKSTIISNKCSATIIIRSSDHVYSILHFYTQAPPSSTKDK